VGWIASSLTLLAMTDALAGGGETDTLLTLLAMTDAFAIDGGTDTFIIKRKYKARAK